MMCSKSVVDLESPFVKKEQCCKVCGTTEGPMESIFCDAEDTAMLDKIYKCTRVEITPVCGLISPICGPCHRRIDAFDENALPKVIEFVIKTEVEHDALEYDPLNVGNLSDPMAVDVKSEEDDTEDTVRLTTRPTKRKIKGKTVLQVDSVLPDLPARRRGRPRKGKSKSPVPQLRAKDTKDNTEEKSIAMIPEKKIDDPEGADISSRPSLKRRGKKSRTSSPDDNSSEENDFNSTDDDELAHEEHGSDIDVDENLLDGDEQLSKDSGDSESQEERKSTLKRNRLATRGKATRPKALKRKAGVPEQCEVCGKTVSYMREHMRLHRIEKQHPCPHCDRTFVQANNLKYHIRKHLGEKPYACKQCDKQFYCEAHLKSHMRVHGPQGLFQCDICPKSFNQECNLKKHLRVHTGEKPYSCDTCGKRFNSTSNLRNHSRLHADERPLTCDHCSKSFVDVHHLQRHIRVHTGVRPYICHVCSQAFYCQSGLMDHLKTHIEKKSFKLD